MSDTRDVLSRHVAAYAALLVVFLGLYFFVFTAGAQRVAVYLLLLIGLWCGHWFTSAVLISSILAAALAVLQGLPSPGLAELCVVLSAAGLTVVPYRYSRVSRAARVAADQKYARREDALRELSANADEYDAHRQVLQQEVEKINHLYVMGRELVEHTEISEVVEHLGKAFLSRPGVHGIAVFLWVKRVWECAYCSPPENISAWTTFLREKDNLSQERRFLVLDSPLWIRDKSVVFWPVRIERYPLAAILLTTDRDAATRFMDEGKIFIPQVALGIKRVQLFTEVKERARNDGLTGLYVRRYFLERLAAEVQRSKRYKLQFSLCMIDIDFFKAVNDTHGHLVGDKVLCALARIFVDCVPPGGLVGRYGGEEFVVMIPNTNLNEAAHVAREIHRLVALKEFTTDAATFHVTVSIGISHFPFDGETPDAIIGAADKALYWVKEHGRNGIHNYSV